MAFCPNCDFEVLAEAAACGRCHAQFGPGSAWNPVDKRSAPTDRSPRSPKIVAWFGLITGVLTAAAPAVFPILSGQALPFVASLVFVALGVATAGAGYFCLKGRIWAFWVLFGLSLIQVAEYFSETFFISFIGPVSLKIGWGWHSPPSQININLLALVIAVLAFVTARRLTAALGDAEH